MNKKIFNKQKKKVLNIVPTPFFADRGCHIRILGKIKALEKHSFYNIICTYHNGRDLKDLDIRRTVNIPWYKKLEAGPSIHKFYIDLLLFFKTLLVYFKEKPDIIFGHLHEGAFIGGLIKYLFTFGRIPLVFDVQGSLTSELETYNWLKSKPIKWLFHNLEKFICKLPDFFICSSESSSDIIKNRFNISPDKVNVVMDGFHVEFSNKQSRKGLRKRLGIPEDSQLIIFTGALLESKGISNLIESIPLVLEKKKDVRFLIVGYPVEKTQKRISGLGVEDSVHMTGSVDYFKLPDYLGIADIAVDPKVDKAGEASGKTINYMAAGLPVVCFDSKNNRNLLCDAGIYACDNKTDNLAEKIIWTVENTKEAKKLGDMNRKRVEQLFSWDKIIKDTVDAFDRLISKQNNHKHIPMLYYSFIAFSHTQVEDIFSLEFLPIF